MTEKQLLNAVEDAVQEALRGFSKLHPGARLHLPGQILFEASSCRKGKVAVVSGGGSGHEPFPAGYVGRGMLAASVSGAVFASPPSSSVLCAIRSVAAESSGVLLVVANYTGDVLNFGLAAETAASEGIPVESVVVGEDVAAGVLGAPAKAGKRGTCGLVLVLKVAGHLADKGAPLDAVRKLAAEAAAATASVGLCVAACCKPGVGRLFDLDREEMELGVGVHGEAGVARLKLLPAGEAVRVLLDLLVPALEMHAEDEAVALVNNLGSLSFLEQWLLAGELEKQLGSRKVRLVRLYAGHLFTSLNMAGVQICLMKLSQESREAILEALDAPTEAPAWPGRPPAMLVRCPEVAIGPAKGQRPGAGPRLDGAEGDLLRRCLERVSEDLLRAESRLNLLDSGCGDGDCGTTFASMGRLLGEAAARLDPSAPARFFLELSSELEASVGGTSGALYGLFLKGVGAELLEQESFEAASALPRCWRAGLEAIKKYSPARMGDRTMLDSLEAGCEVFERLLRERREAGVAEAFGRAVEAAEEGCRKTRFMLAGAGRASHTNPSRQEDVDAGAYAATVWLSAVQRAIDGHEGP